MKLLDCPFCGGTAMIEREGSHRVSCIVSCQYCGATVEANETFNQGAQWNHRHQDQWIPVSTRLPEVRCLAYTPDSEDQPDRGYRIIPEGLFKTATTATHWQPLPPQPQEKDSD